MEVLGHKGVVSDGKVISWEHIHKAKMLYLNDRFIGVCFIHDNGKVPIPRSQLSTNSNIETTLKQYLPGKYEKSEIPFPSKSTINIGSIGLGLLIFLFPSLFSTWILLFFATWTFGIGFFDPFKEVFDTRWVDAICIGIGIILCVTMIMKIF